MSVKFDIGYLPQYSAGECIKHVKMVEDAGMDGFWIADSQSIFREGYVLLAAAAQKTSSLTLASGVTNPETRHPTVIAGSFSTLQELSGGRIILGIGRGESAVRTIGEEPSTLSELKETVRVLRRLWDGEHVQFGDRELKLNWPAPEVPVYIASSGPRSLQLAGAIADGVLFQVGSIPDLIDYALTNIRTGAENHGRSLDEVELCCRLGCMVSEDAQQARRDMKSYASIAAGTVYEAVPPEDLPEELKRDIKQMKDQYDYHEHGSGEARHSQLVTDRILDSVAVAGDPSDVFEGLTRVIDQGVDRIVMTLPEGQLPVFLETFSNHLRPQLEKRD